MNCPVCSKRHNKYITAIVCIRPVQNRHGYCMLAGREVPAELQELYDKVCEYERYWEAREAR